jgi:hypothetical protein
MVATNIATYMQYGFTLRHSHGSSGTWPSAISAIDVRAAVTNCASEMKDGSGSTCKQTLLTMSSDDDAIENSSMAMQASAE